jgi:hypothetical protein
MFLTLFRTGGQSEEGEGAWSIRWGLVPIRVSRKSSSKPTMTARTTIIIITPMATPSRETMVMTDTKERRGLRYLNARNRGAL